jgi:DnaK suppressor protein
MEEQAVDLNEFKALLMARSAELKGMEESATQAAQTVELDQSRVGRLSRMDALQGQAMAKETNRRRQLELTRIGAALRRIEAGDYGMCLRCEELIAPARLRFDPSATLCMECASASNA